MADLVLDTDAASVLQKHRAPAWVERSIVGNVTWLTFVTAAELAAWAESCNWDAPNRARLDEWIARQPASADHARVGRSAPKSPVIAPACDPA